MPWIDFSNFFGYLIDRSLIVLAEGAIVEFLQHIESTSFGGELTLYKTEFIGKVHSVKFKGRAGVSHLI